MQGKDQSGAIALSLLIMCGFGAIVYFLLRKKKAIIDIPTTPAVLAPTIQQKISTGYTKDLNALSETVIKKYAGWIDKIEELAKVMKSKRSAAPAELIKNCKEIMNLSDPTIIGTVAYWESRRGRKISTLAAFNGVLDVSESLPQLLVRFRELNLM